MHQVEPASHRYSPPAARSLVLLGLFALAWLNFRFPVVRLWHPAASTLAFGLLQLLPVLSAAQWIRIRPRQLGAAALFMHLPFVAWGGLWLILVGLQLSTVAEHRDFRDFAPDAELRTRAGLVRAYSLGSAVGPYVMGFRHERMVFPGVMLVRELGSERNANGATLHVRGPWKVESILSIDGAEVRGRTFTLARYVWF